MTEGPRILALDEDRNGQAQIAQAFNQSNVFYRFLSDKKKTLGGLKQLKPDLLMIFGELYDEFASEVLSAVSNDVTWAQLPIVVVCQDVSDAKFVTGLRTGVIELLQAPFDPRRHISELKLLYGSLPARRGEVRGHSESKELARLVEHLRRTRRSGLLIMDPQTPRAARASFALGKPETVRFQQMTGLEALVKMVTQSQAQWSFREVGTPRNEGAVVIKVAPPAPSDDDVPVVAGVLEEEPARASTFEVPVDNAANRTDPRMAMPRFTAQRLLLVDDDESLGRMFTTLFTKHGFEVTQASDGIEGYEAAQHKAFDAVIADLNMPRMDGWGMLRQLRDDFRTRELPVAFLSCHDDYREQLKALDAGAQAYFSKGTGLGALVSQVRRLLEPRLNVEGQLDVGQAFRVTVDHVGPQWLLRTLSDRKITGRLDAQDSWALYRLHFHEGFCKHATAEAGKHTAQGERAFNAFIASHGSVGEFSFDAQESPQSLFHDTTVLLAKACSTLTQNEQRMREALLVTASDPSQIEVNPELYEVYRQVGPRQWLEAARLICEEKVPPREVLSRIDASPIEVEETLKDLLRRGVVTIVRGN